MSLSSLFQASQAMEPCCVNKQRGGRDSPPNSPGSESRASEDSDVDSLSSEESVDLEVSEAIEVSTHQDGLVWYTGRVSHDPRYTIRELEEIYLSIRQREVTIEIEKNEEELGRHLSHCMRVIAIMTSLHRERCQITNKQVLVSHGASRDRAFEYQNEMQSRISELSYSSMFDPKRCHQPPVSSIGRKLRLIGNRFFSEPSLLSLSFNRLWNSLWSNT